MTSYDEQLVNYFFRGLESISSIVDIGLIYIRPYICSKKKSIIFAIEIEWKNNGFFFTIPNIRIKYFF